MIALSLRFHPKKCAEDLDVQPLEKRESVIESWPIAKKLISGTYELPMTGRGQVDRRAT